MKECITHHWACDCREALHASTIQSLQEENEKLAEALGIIRTLSFTMQKDFVGETHEVEPASLLLRIRGYVDEALEAYRKSQQKGETK
jgi:hypothetical protein